MFITKSSSTMAALMFIIALFLGMSGCSNGNYCLCKDGLSEKVLQENIDYACGSGADCNPILQNGGCYQPNTVKAHCDYACNNFYQKKSQVSGSCDFSGTAYISSSPPTTVASGCTFPASTSQVTGSGSSSTTTADNDSTAPTGNPAGNSGRSHQASPLLIGVTTLVSGLLVLWV